MEIRERQILSISMMMMMMMMMMILLLSLLESSLINALQRLRRLDR
jgi:hypothetical protein